MPLLDNIGDVLQRPGSAVSNYGNRYRPSDAPDQIEIKTFPGAFSIH